MWHSIPSIFFIGIIFTSLALGLPACLSPQEAPEEENQQQPAKAEDKAQEVVNLAIEAHGGAAFEQSLIEMDFRDRHYIVERNGEDFRYERLFNDGEDQYRDRLDNKGFTRWLNGEIKELSDRKASSYTNSVNSVAYFLVLPYRLNDAAVNKKYLGTAEVEGKNYHKVEITFEQEGGGKDYDDVFVYWFHTETYYMDYFAYSYHTDGGGMRFRKAINPRVIEGLRIQDYINYKGSTDIPTSEQDRLFNEGQLEELSRIENENVEVSLSAQ